MTPHSTRPLFLDAYLDPPSRSQAESFQRVQAGMRQKHPEKFEALRDIALRLAASVGDRGFTADELMQAAGGRKLYPRNLPGVVLGNLRSMHALCVVGREKSRHPERKGAWGNRFALNGAAIRVDP